jgi:hypothetical protein
MNTIKYIFLCLVRLILVVAAPRFAFFLASKDCLHTMTKIGLCSAPLDRAEIAELCRGAREEELDSLGHVMT